MKLTLKLLLFLTVLAVSLFFVWQKLPHNPGGGLPDPDSTARAELDRLSRAFDSAQVAFADSLARDRARRIAEIEIAEAGRRDAEQRTRAFKARADSLARALAKEREDDDSLAGLVTLVAAKDSVIVGLGEELDAAAGKILILTVALERADTATAILTRAIREAVRQRDSYRRFTQRCRVQITAGYGGVQSDGIKTGPGLMAGYGCRF